MEIVALGGIAALAASSMLGLLGCADGEERPGRTPREVLADAAGAVAAAAHATGSLLLDSGAVPAGAGSIVADEVRGLRAGGREPFARVDAPTALGGLVFACAGVGALLGVLSWSALGFVAGLAALPILLWLRAGRRGRTREAKVAEAMPEAFGALAISLESGLSLTQAMRYVGGHSEEPIRGEFMCASFAMSCGVSATEALDDLVENLSAPGLELVSLALKISQRTGAPLKDLLAEASALAGERIELARRLDVKTSQARMSAQLVAAMPVAMVGLLSLLSSDFRAGLATATGAASVSVALVLNVVAWLIIRKIMKVEL